MEELYFRSVLLPWIEPLPQAFAFALAHSRLIDPVSLAESALLVPCYLLLGIALGVVAERGGYIASAAVHAAYNTLSVTYALAFNVTVPARLLALDCAVLIATCSVRGTRSR